MPSEKTLAIVLRAIDFSETSAVVTLFTRDYGKISALAKGARRPKGPFESALDLLAVCRIVFLHKSSDTLDLLTEAKLERKFRAAGRDLARLYAGYYVAELLGELTDRGDPHPELFDAALATLELLDPHEPGGPAQDNPVDLASLVLRFELTALRLLGHLPSLGQCAECGRPVATAARVAFGQLAGGVLCPQCRPGKRHVVSVSGPVIDTLSRFAKAENNNWKAEPVDRRVRGELRGVLNHYLSHLLGHAPKMHRYLGMLAG